MAKKSKSNAKNWIGNLLVVKLVLKSKILKIFQKLNVLPQDQTPYLDPHF